MASILLIDDDDDLTHYANEALTRRGHRVECLDSPQNAPELLARGGYDLVLLDNKMPRMSGIEFLEALQQRRVRVPVILMTSHATTDVAIQAMNLGAFDYVVKPEDFAALCAELDPLIDRAATIARAMQEHVRLPGDSVSVGAEGPVLLGNSRPMLEVYKLIGRFANSSAPILVLGETGTGKELVARAVHSNSPRKSEPFVSFSCNVPDEVGLDELVGHEPGAFPGADKLRKGSFEHANGGTLFLDKVADLPRTLQAMVLGVLESGRVQRQGNREAIPVDVRLVVAARPDLDVAVHEGRFREDLYYRLQEITIRLPALRERGSDLQLLADHFARQAAAESNRPAPILLEDTRAKLRGYHWPGNVRELRNTVRRAVQLSQGPHLLPADLELGSVERPRPQLDGSGAVAEGGNPSATQSHNPPLIGEQEAVGSLQQAIRWALQTGQPNPSRLLHAMLDRELERTSATESHATTSAAWTGPQRLAEFVQSIRQSGLLESEQQDELERHRLPGSTTPELVNELLRRGWLTPWQAEALSQGKERELILGQYVLLDLLGQGGMGQVFKARQRRLKRLTALKVIRPERLTSPSAVQRFHRETEAAARLAHPNIVQIYDAAEVGGRFFLAMEYVEGVDLGQRLQEQGRLPVARACEFIYQAALGLQHAHECGLVHRDIKPSNLLLAARGGLVKILDFGLARLAPAAEQEMTGDQLTQTGVLMGTPDYIAPEQAMNAGAADIRADLYSLGCTFYHCLTGQAPFSGSTITQKLLQHQLEQPAPIESLRPDVPPLVVCVVARLMAKRPEDRYTTPAAVVAAMGELVHSTDDSHRSEREPAHLVQGARRAPD